MQKYATKINEIGPSAEAFFGEKMLILFGENAPAELREFCLLIDINAVEDDINVGDTLQLGENTYKITAVGDAVRQNLAQLGHITLKFDGATEAELPGTLYLEDSEVTGVNAGAEIKIYS